MLHSHENTRYNWFDITVDEMYQFLSLLFHTIPVHFLILIPIGQFLLCIMVFGLISSDYRFKSSIVFMHIVNRFSVEKDDKLS